MSFVLIFLSRDTAAPEIYTLSLHDALPISGKPGRPAGRQESHRIPRLGPGRGRLRAAGRAARSEEHTSELQSLRHLVCRLLLEKKKTPATARSWSNATATSRSLPSR